MNERIKELAGQALDKAVPGTWTTLTAYDLDMFTEKFAELIIKECLDQCYNKGMNDSLYEGQLKAASYIEGHFGVK